MPSPEPLQPGEDGSSPVIELHISGTVTYMNAAANAKFPDLPSLGLKHPILEGLPAIVRELRDHDQRTRQREIRASGGVFEQRIVMAQGSDFIRIYINDLTDRKRTEAHLQMADRSIVKLVTDLKQSERRLLTTESTLIQAEKLGALGQMASGIAHEVKNPLAILMKGVNYLEREPGFGKGERAEVLKIMKEAIVRADRIIREMLDFARPAPLELKPSVVADVLEGALDLAEKQLTTSRIRIVKDFAPDLAPALIDENRLKQAFLNLIRNALQAMPDGGTLTIRAYPQQLTQVGPGVGRRETDVFHVGQSVLVCTIQDTGHGISAAMVSEVFNPFFTTKSPGEGTGLGLTVTKTIIEQHRGLITIDSQEGRGTTMTVILPTVQ
jgi:signal transduction histidine kinase